MNSKVMPITFNIDSNVNIDVVTTVMKLRQKGHKGVSKAMILNLATRFLLDEIDKKGIKVIEKMILEHKNGEDNVK